MHLRSRLVTLGLLTFLLVPAACQSHSATPAATATLRPIATLRATTSSGYIGKQQAIALARDYPIFKAIPQGTPKVVAASLVTMDKAQHGLGVENLAGLSADTMVWMVKMEGLWLLQGPPLGPGTPSAPIEMKNMTVVIDARTGDSLEVRN